MNYIVTGGFAKKPKYSFKPKSVTHIQLDTKLT